MRLRHYYLCWRIWRNAKEIRKLDDEPEGNQGNNEAIVFLIAALVMALILSASGTP